MARTGLEREIIHGEIREQPRLAEAHAGHPAPRWPAPQGRVVLAGAGDSRCAAELVAALFPHRRLSAPGALAASAAACSLGSSDALVGISVSGRTPRVLEALRRARLAGAYTVAVTDDPAAPLAQEAHEVWPIRASPPEALATSDYTDPEAARYVGYHHDVAQTKTFLGAFLAVARAAAGGEGAAQRSFAELPAVVARCMADERRDALQEQAEELSRAERAFVLGGATTAPLARFCAYKLIEFDRPAVASDLEEYCHTHYFVTRPGDAVVALASGKDDLRRALELLPVLVELFAARVLLIVPEDLSPPPLAAVPAVAVPAASDPLLRHVALLVASQWLGYLWGRLRCPDPDRFHGGIDTERLVAGTLRTIRGSRIVPPPAAEDGEAGGEEVSGAPRR